MTERPVCSLACSPPPTRSTLGNYIGALLQWKEMQTTYDAFFCVVDLHAITVPQDPAQLREQTRRTAAQYIAAGIDPSSVDPVRAVARAGARRAGLGAEHHHRLRRGQPDDPVQGQVGRSRARMPRRVGLFAYPMLMAADILLYDTERRAGRRRPAAARRAHPRPRRALQLALRRHLRRARGGASSRRPRSIYDLQNPTSKMSKSAESRGRHHLAARRAVEDREEDQAAVTDTEREIRFDREAKPGVSNLLTIYSVAHGGGRSPSSRPEYAGRGYGDLKKELAEVVVEHVRADPRAHARAARRPGRARPRARAATPTAPSEVAEADARDGVRPRRLPPPRALTMPPVSAPHRPARARRSPSRPTSTASLAVLPGSRCSSEYLTTPVAVHREPTPRASSREYRAERLGSAATELHLGDPPAEGAPLLGVIGLRQRGGNEIGFWLGAPHRGDGIMSRGRARGLRLGVRAVASPDGTRATSSGVPSRATRRPPTSRGRPDSGASSPARADRCRSATAAPWPRWHAERRRVIDPTRPRSDRSSDVTLSAAAAVERCPIPSCCSTSTTPSSRIARRCAPASPCTCGELAYDGDAAAASGALARARGGALPLATSPARLTSRASAGLALATSPARTASSSTTPRRAPGSTATSSTTETRGRCTTTRCPASTRSHEPCPACGSASSRTASSTSSSPSSSASASAIASSTSSPRAMSASTKPDPRIFRIALERFGVGEAAGRAAYVGDRLRTDAIGAADRRPHRRLAEPHRRRAVTRRRGMPRCSRSPRSRSCPPCSTAPRRADGCRLARLTRALTTGAAAGDVKRAGRTPMRPALLVNRTSARRSSRHHVAVCRAP